MMLSGNEASKSPLTCERFTANDAVDGSVAVTPPFTVLKRAPWKSRVNLARTRPLTVVACSEWVPAVSMSIGPFTVAAFMLPSIPFVTILPFTVVTASDTVFGTRRT